MPFADELSVEIEKNNRPTCASCQWYSSLSDDDRQRFDEFAAAAPYGYKALMYRAASRSGYVGSVDQFTHHLNEHHGRVCGPINE